jgi:hypothetical protein
MERTYSINSSASTLNDYVDLEDNINNSTNETKLLNSDDKIKLKTNCCVYMYELLYGLACCYK